MPVRVSLGCAGSVTAGTLPRQSCPCVPVRRLQGAAASPALGHPTLSLGTECWDHPRAARSWEGCCLWPGCSGLLAGELAASPHQAVFFHCPGPQRPRVIFASSEGRKRHPAAPSPERMRFLRLHGVRLLAAVAEVWQGAGSQSIAPWQLGPLRGGTGTPCSGCGVQRQSGPGTPAPPAWGCRGAGRGLVRPGTPA